MSTATSPRSCISENSADRSPAIFVSKQWYIVEFPQRKTNRIPEFDYSANGAYFVTICTENRSRILCDIVGDGSPVPKPAGLLAEEYLRNLPEKYPTVCIDNYVIMPDHIHILLRIEPGTGKPSPTLGNIIGWYKYQVTKQYNAQANTQGSKLFQRSYYDHTIRNQADYDEVWLYIDHNPSKWVLQNHEPTEIHTACHFPVLP